MPITKVRRISIELEQPTKRDNDSRPFVDVLLADIRESREALDSANLFADTKWLARRRSKGAPIGQKNLLLNPS
jgi:hypothetical protein